MAYLHAYVRPAALWLVGGIVWAAAIGAGGFALMRYEYAPGAQGMAPAHWPAGTHIPRRTNRFSLVFFAHPDCSCTRASLEELDTLPPTARGRLDIFVEVRKPGLTIDEASASQLWKDAAAMPGVRVSLDSDGREARTFGAQVSGQTMLYDERGDLIFSGGVTAARGHIGDNTGLDSILLRVEGRPAPLDRTPVFGCSLRDPTREERANETAWTRQR